MSPPNLSFKCAIVTGGAGGLGRAIAEWLLSIDRQIILVGRTEEKLKQTAKELGGSVPYYVLDTGDTKAIPGFAKSVTMDHPEVDCLINNAGVQRPLKVEDFDLAAAVSALCLKSNAHMLS